MRAAAAEMRVALRYQRDYNSHFNTVEVCARGSARRTVITEGATQCPKN